MKKLLIIMCAALFVAAMVLPAAAADMSVSGFYRVRGFYVSNQDAGQATPWDSSGALLTSGSPDAWWDHMLQLNPVFKVADNLKLVTQVSAFNNSIFGSTKTSGATPHANSNETTTIGTVSAYGEQADNVLVNRAYIDWKTAYGTFKFGRQAAGVTFLPFANSTTDGDRIRWDSPTWNGFQVTAYTQKNTESDASSTSNAAANADKDTYRIAVQYTQPCYFLGYALDYGHDRTGGSSYKANTITHNACVKANDPSKTFFFQGELQLLRGDHRDYYGATADIDKKGYGYYAAVGMTKGPLTVAVAAIGVSGDDNASDTEAKAGPATGLDFQPLYLVFSPHSNILVSSTGGNGTARLNSTLSGLTDNTTTNPDDTGLKAYAILADYAVNPQLTLHAGIGTASADKVGSGRDDDFGTEFDLGLKYQIMSNLAYELRLGYLATGDYWKGASANTYKTDDIYQIDHSLTLSF